MPARYDLAPEAEADLGNIWSYTLEKWGESQADRYLGFLENAFHDIADGDVISRVFSPDYPNIRATRCEHHYIFYLPGKKKRPVIIAVLHERMDLVYRLGKRLHGAS